MARAPGRERLALAQPVAEALARLGVARGRFLVNGVYVMARDGTVVAHETPGLRSTGINLAFRPYFQQAIEGVHSVHAAVGSNSAACRQGYPPAALHEAVHVLLEQMDRLKVRIH